MGSVLFADDEPWFLEPHQFRLEQEGHKVFSATSAQEALDLLSSTPVDVLVLDIMMPYERLEDLIKGGVEAIREAPRREIETGIRLYPTLRKTYPNVKIIVLSVLAEEEIREKSPNIQWDCVFLRKGGNRPSEVYDAICNALTSK